MGTTAVTAPRTTVLEVDGVRTPLLEAGPSDTSEAVVLVHGNPGSSRDWTGLVSHTGTFARAVAWDHPGYGRSQVADGFPYTVDGYANHLGRVLDHLGIERAHLVLHDFGGPWGLTWAAAHPHRFASATLLNTGVLLGYRWHRFARIWRTPLLGELFMATATRAGFHLSMKLGTQAPPPPAFVDQMYADFDPTTRRAVLALYRATGDIAERSQRLAVALCPLDRPTLVVWGRHDPYIPVEQAEKQRQTFPSAEVHILDGSGHWCFADDPDRVATLVIPFLQRTTSR